jgi:hypothetical protein
MLTAKQVVDKYFLETRCMLVEIAATLDRLDRAAERQTNGQPYQDDRVELIRKSLAFLADKKSGPHRSEKLLLMFSDPES